MIKISLIPEIAEQLNNKEMTVEADDGDEAIAKVKARVRKSMTLPNYADGYKIISSEERED